MFVVYHRKLLEFVVKPNTISVPTAVPGYRLSFPLDVAINEVLFSEAIIEQDVVWVIIAQNISSDYQVVVATPSIKDI